MVAALIGGGDDLVCGTGLAQTCSIESAAHAAMANEWFGLCGWHRWQCHQCDGTDFDDCFAGDEKRPPRNHTSGQSVLYFVQAVSIYGHVCGRTVAVYLGGFRHDAGGVCVGFVVVVGRAQMATALVAGVVSKSGVVDVGGDGGIAVVAIAAFVVVEISGLSTLPRLINRHPCTNSVHKGVDNWLKP